MIYVSPSILAADFGDLRNQIKIVEEGKADMLHIDVMDGHYVPNISFGAGMVKKLREDSKLFFDVHLMIDNPEKFVDEYIEAGADLITVHYEASKHIHRLVQYIKSCGIKAGVAINPGTPAVVYEELADMIDLALVMTVNPGFTAQKFIEGMVPKIKKVADMLPKGKYIEVDGGIGPKNAAQVISAGANTLVAGASVFYAEDPAAAIAELHSTKI